MRVILDDLHIDLSRQQVMRGRELLDVKGLSFQLLACLIEQGSRVVTYDELMHAIWSPAIVNEETVTQRVRLLRAALGDDGRQPRYIRSVRGRGYQLCMEPEQLESKQRFRSPMVLGLTLTVACAALAVVLAMAKSPGSQETESDKASGYLERADYYAGIGQAENNERAIALYRQVLVESPENIHARIGLSFALSAATCQFDAAPQSAVEAGEWAHQVLEIHARNARAHAALAYSNDCLGLIDAAIAGYEQAVALDPEGRRDSAASVAHLYAIKGRLADALRLNVHALPDRDRLRFVGLQLAHVLDLLGFHVAAEQRYAEEFALYPDNVFVNAAYPAYLFARGRLSEAKTILAEARTRPARPELLLLAGEIHLLEGEREQARQRFMEAADLRSHLGLPATLAGLYGEREPDADWFEQQINQVQAAIQAGDRWPNNWLELALLQWHRGQHDAAIQALHDALAHGYRDVAYLAASPLFSDLRQHPGFVQIADRMNMAVAAEREKVLAAEWLPAPLLSVSR